MYRTRIALLAAALSLAAAPLAAQTPIRPGETVRGALEESDPRLEGGQHYDAYVIQGRPGGHLIVTMRSDEIDTFLHWGRAVGGAWTSVDENDDSGGETNSRLVVTADTAGGLQLRASSFNEDETGAYELQVYDPAMPIPQPMYLDHVLHGELGEDTDFRGTSGPEDHYTIEGPAGSRFVAVLESTEFDPSLVLGVWENGVLRELSAGQGGVVRGEFSAGEHRLVVRSSSGRGGSYLLRLQGAGR